jgi:glycerol kinase
VDGGATANDLLMQMQADVLGLPVERPAVLETTALGAALLAGIEAGFFADASAIDGARRVERVFEPTMPAADRRRLLDRWHDGVERSKRWAQSAP